MNQSDLSKHRVVKHPLRVQKIKTGNKVVSVKENHAAISVAHNIWDQFSPLGQGQNIMTNATSRLEFQVFGTRINHVKGFFVEIPITNNSVTDSLEMVSPYFFCTLIEILIDNNSVQEVYPESNLFAHRMMTDEQTLSLTRLTNLLYPQTITGRDVAGLNPLLIAPGETRYIYLPINNSLFEQTKIPFGSIKSTIRFRLTFDIFGSVTTSSNAMVIPGNMSVGAIQLYCIGSAVSAIGSDEIKTVLADDYSANYYKTERQVINNGNNTLPGARPKQSLTNLNGTYCSILIMLRALNPTQENQYQWKFSAPTYNPNKYQISEVTLYDSNGSPYSLNNLGFFLAKWQSPVITGSDDEGSKYSSFSDKLSFVQFDLGDRSWEELRLGNPSGVTINNSWSIEYNVGNQGPYISPFAASAFPVLGEATETCVLADRLYSVYLDSNGRLKCMAQ
jgi:hypothetical protein